MTRASDIVREDLEFLADTFFTGEVTPSELRRASVIVRQLLHQALLPQALTALGRGGSLRLEAFPIDQVLPPRDKMPDVLLAMAGGSRFRTRSFGPVVLSDNAPGMPEHFQREHYKLPNYLKAVCLVAQGQTVTRRTLIKYMANKLGGAHYDQRRGGSDRDMEALDHLEFLTVDGFHPAFLELLAIIQSLIASPAAMEPFGLSPRPTALFDTPSSRAEGPVTLTARAYNNLDRIADLKPER